MGKTYPIGATYTEWRDCYALIRRSMVDGLAAAGDREYRQIRRLAGKTGDYEAAWYKRSMYRKPRVVRRLGSGAA